MRKLKDAVVVVTGASSGIGRATALAFARKGSAVVVAARREEALREAADDCRRAGARALAVPTDVTDPKAVEELARRVAEEFGRIDVWVNNAAVSLFGRFEEVPLEDWRRVIDTNLMGYVHGLRSVMPYLREQGSGVVINNASVFGKMGAPHLTAYVTSKFGIVGLSESLRAELSLDDADIHVCTVLPASIDTPIFQHAANRTGRAVKPLRPVYPVHKVANAIVGLATRPRRELIVGSAGRGLYQQRLLAPGLAERLLARQVDRDHFTEQPAEPTTGNLYEPMPEWTEASGGWPSSRGPILRPVLVLGGAAAGGWWLRRRQRGRD